MSGTISVDLSAITSSSSSQSGSSNQSRIAALRKQPDTLTKELAAISKDDTLNAKQKVEKGKLIQAQIELIQAQIAQLEAEEAKKSEKSASKAGTASTAERPDTSNTNSADNTPSATKKAAKGRIDTYA